MTSPSLDTTHKTWTLAGDFVPVTIGTFLGSLANQQSFISKVDLLVNGNIFPSEKKSGFRRRFIFKELRSRWQWKTHLVLWASESICWTLTVYDLYRTSYSAIRRIVRWHPTLMPISSTIAPRPPESAQGPFPRPPQLLTRIRGNGFSSGEGSPRIR